MLEPYIAAKAAMDSLAVTCAGELSRWGIETSIIVPECFTKGTNRFPTAESPSDTTTEEEYDDGAYRGPAKQVFDGLAELEPNDADVGEVAEAIVNVVGTPFGKRPLRVYIDPSKI